MHMALQNPTSLPYKNYILILDLEFLSLFWALDCHKIILFVWGRDIFSGNFGDLYSYLNMFI